MAVYLVQHGIAASADVDPQRGLNDEGRSDVERIAQVAAGYNVHVEAIWHSGKTRAVQTAEIFAQHLKPASGIEKKDGMNPNDAVDKIAVHLKPESEIMLVGHLPFMEKLASYLVTGESELLIFKAQNGGILCLDQGANTQRWFIKWGLMPHIS